MPKQKTKSGAKKRFKVTGSGKVKFRGANRSHNFTNESGKTGRQRRRSHYLADQDVGSVNRMLGLE